MGVASIAFQLLQLSALSSFLLNKKNQLIAMKLTISALLLAGAAAVVSGK